MAMRDSPSREELFAMVWERPTIDVAKELGISDVALGKLCKRLQVPKPPRGYWQRVAAGETIALPPLLAYREEVKSNRKKASPFPIKFTELQWSYVKNALELIENHGVDTSSAQTGFLELKSIDSDLTAQLIIFIQNRFHEWMPKDASSRKVQGAHKCVSSIIDKLMPITKKTVVVLPFRNDKYSSDSSKSFLLLHTTPAFVHSLSELHKFLISNKLTRVGRDLDQISHAWHQQYMWSSQMYGPIKSELILTPNDLWIQCEIDTYGERETVETERVELTKLFPIDLLEFEFTNWSDNAPLQVRDDLRELARDLVSAETLHTSISEALYEFEGNIPTEKLCLIERLFVARPGDRHMAGALNEWRSIQDIMETWELELDHEKDRLCKEILGVTEGDNVIVSRNGEAFRMRLDRCWMSADDSSLSFSLRGRKYRKDGLLGKREEYAYLKKHI